MAFRIDHVMICVPDLARGVEQYRKLGFNMFAGGDHPGKGTHNAVAFNDADYVELLSIRDRAEYDAAGRSGWAAGTLADFISGGGGIRYIVIQSDDLVADVAAMRKRGVEIADPVEGARRTPSGLEWRWKAAALGGANPLPLMFIEHLTPWDMRRKEAAAAGRHPNAVFTLERVYIVTEDAEAAAAIYARVLGLPQPPLQKGTVIMSHMAVFQLGSMGLGVVHPYADGPAKDALERRGPGPFQALYRTTSMGSAARWIDKQGLPPLARGVRNTGEHAMLATPDVACGAYIGFVGPE